ncbi:class I SAM-dependent methyltransferase [Taibaiella koreensis]|uniref:class I SAM-dependent methyltransferase n=1 Tax=Taibaiella koreensis TaxID=1268548 RepID=UPI000E59FAE2|nr:class I SAM-dependent methyltransferase [Taibaiella koreensis]
MNNINLTAEREVAYESLDHLNPWGTKRDNSRNSIFNRKVYKIFNESNVTLKVLDLGCSGGGFVKNCIDDGCVAIGLEGSDFSKKHKRAEWRSIPENLFTCDITRTFQLSDETGKEMIFDLITSWEVLEHIEEKDLKPLFENIQKHLSHKGLCIVSICYVDDIINGVNLHRTVKPKSWWLEKVKELGMYHLPQFETYFSEQYIRGRKYNAPNTFHLILTTDPLHAPSVPNKGFKERLLDKWLGSKCQKLLKLIVTGEHN